MELTQEYTKKTITRNQVITHLGISMTCDEWADRLCVNVYTLISRLRRNPVNIAINTEVHTKGGKKYLVNNKYVTAKWMAEKADVSVTTIYKRMKLMPL